MPGEIKLNYDFSQFIEVVELVNEPQSLLINILKINHKLKGIFFGKAEYIENIRNSLDDDLKKRSGFIKGDLFTSVLPAGYQVYLLKDIIGSLEETQSIKFLTGCFQATENYTRFLFIEKGKFNKIDEVSKYHKVLERYGDIFKQAGFILTNVINSGNNTDILEVLRR